MPLMYARSPSGRQLEGSHTNYHPGVMQSVSVSLILVWFVGAQFVFSAYSKWFVFSAVSLCACRCL